MNLLYRNLFVWSLIFYVTVVIFTRFVDGPKFRNISLTALYMLPLEFMDGRDKVKLETCILSESQVAEFLKSNPANCANVKLDSNQAEYAIVRYDGHRHFGDLKVYFSCFSHPIIVHISMNNSLKIPFNLIIPLPYQSTQNKCKVQTRWKNFW